MIFTRLYRPMIVGWLHRQGVADRDVDDLIQEIFLAVGKVYHAGRRSTTGTCSAACWA